jgi:predicted dehydrogenase
VSEPLRIGILGAARIAPPALVQPAATVPGAEVTAVAARDRERAEAFAAEHGIPRVFASYAELVESPEIDAVYNPLPISLHCEWTLRALHAGKHVLCEKAFACNAEEAERMAAAARETGRVLVEAFHWRYHPMAARLIELCRDGSLGRIERLESHFYVPHIPAGDIRTRYETGGGATMDLGCYPIHLLRQLTGEEPEVVSAEAEVGPPDVDVWLAAELRFPGGASGRIESSMKPDAGLAMELRVQGTQASLHARNPIAPHIGNRISIETRDGTSEQSISGEATYVYQLRAFVDAVRSGASVPTGPDDAIANMRVIDACYRAAGLPLRGRR